MRSNVIKMPDPHDLVGVKEIANVTGVSPQAVINWTDRYEDFPKPLATLRMGRVWDYRDVAVWLRKHGRDT